MHEIDALRQLLAQPRQAPGDWAVLVTIIATEGSTYRGPGAKLVVTQSGKMAGVISGGCFDSALYEHARTCHQEQRWKEVTFDLRDDDDVLFGMGLGCPGMIRLLLEPMSWGMSDAQLDLVIGNRLLNEPQFVEITFAPDGSVVRRLLDSGDSTINTGLIAEARFVERRLPQLRLTLVGCGADAVPLVTFANHLGWRLRLVDHRPSNLERMNHDSIAEIYCQRPGEFFAAAEVSERDAILLMSHNFLIDQEALTALAQSSCRYVGALGPARRGQRLREEVTSELHVPEEFWQNFYNPVGLNIASESPEEIALSAIAEIQAVMYGKPSGHLRDLGKSGHGRG